MCNYMVICYYIKLPFCPVTGNGSCLEDITVDEGFVCDIATVYGDNIKGTLCYVLINCRLMHMKPKDNEETQMGHKDAYVNYKFSNIYIYVNYKLSNIYTHIYIDTYVNYKLSNTHTHTHIYIYIYIL